MKSLPKIRNENIIVQKLKNEVLIYEPATNQAFCLNETSAKVYNHCDGATSFDELKRRYKFTDDLIFLALDELRKENLKQLKENTMKTMKSLKFTAITILILSFAMITQAQTKYALGADAGGNSFFNVLSPVNFFSGSTRCADVKTPLTDAEIDEIIRIHNRVRADVGTAPLKWNCDLAKFSQSWAEKDTNEHSTQQQREQIFKGSSAGENLAADSSPTAAVAALHQGWIDEKQFWDAGKQICATDKVCGHYTQMVWKTSTDIGCGIVRNGNSLGAAFKGQVSYIVCTYNPGGNMDGEKAH